MLSRSPNFAQAFSAQLVINDLTVGAMAKCPKRLLLGARRYLIHSLRPLDSTKLQKTPLIAVAAPVT